MVKRSKCLKQLVLKWGPSRSPDGPTVHSICPWHWYKALALAGNVEVTESSFPHKTRPQGKPGFWGQSSTNQIYLRPSGLREEESNMRGWHYPCFLCVWKWKSFSHVRLFVTPKDCSPPGSSAYGNLQARMLEWAAIPILILEAGSGYSEKLRSLVQSTKGWMVEMRLEPRTTWVQVYVLSSVSLYL